MTSTSDDKLPQRPPSHVIGDQALSSFLYKIKPEWARNIIQQDYGTDVLVTVVQKENVTDDFFVQLKGHDKPHFSDDKRYISESIEVTTVNSLLRKSMPSMLCVCDVSNGERLFYVWVNEDIERIERENPDWKKQGTVTIRVPVDNVIERDAIIHKGIEEYVTKFHISLRNDIEIMNVLSPSLGIDKESLGTLQKDVLLQIARPTLEKAGLIDDSSEDIETYSPEDQELLRKIRDVSVLLNNFQDNKAKRDLDELFPQIEKIPVSLKAKYLNNYGVYYSHIGDLANAVKCYKDAFSFSPRNHKIHTNYLFAEFEHLRRSNQIEKEQIKDWMESLESLLKENPDFHPAIRTKAYFIGETVGGKEAESYLLATETWEAEPIESRICLAELYMREDAFDKAKELLKAIEGNDSFVLYSLLGFINLSLATGTSHKDTESYMTGMGPSLINSGVLGEAEDNYKRAYGILSRLGFPPYSEEIIVNYSVVLDLRFKHEESLRICRAFLELNPDSLLIQAALAQSYFGLGRPEKALPFAKKAFEGNPNGTTLKNYCICLFEAEEHDAVVSLITENSEKEITKKEKGVFLSLLALSCNEIGNILGSREAINKLVADENLAGDAVTVEAAIARRNGQSREETLRYYSEGKNKYSENMILLTNYVAILNPTNRTEAEEIVECFEKILPKRELFPDEYTVFSRAYLTLNNPDEALAVIRKAHDRYPESLKVLYALAMALTVFGAEEGAYTVLKEYLSKSSADYTQIRNLAFLAYQTGRIEESISLLQKALGKTTDIKERGEIHCHLFELKRIAGRIPSELIRHVHEFGKTVGADDNLEARYLSMFLLATTSSVAEDDESKEWFDTARERLRIFSEKNPRNPFLKSVKFDLTVPEEEKGREILSTIMAEMLPHSIRTDKLRVAVRGGNLPLSFRASYLGSHSIFEYWARCSMSKETEDRLHIWNPNNGLQKEFEAARKAKQICIDISALLTLAGLDLLDVLQEFDLIILARGTKYLLDKEFAGVTPPHELAQKINRWRLQNKYKIRIRNSGGDENDDIESQDNEIYETTAGGLFIRRDVSLKETISGGMGESILIARQMKIPFYSDDSVIRFLGSHEYGCETFSTISLLDTLVDKGNMKIEGASEILARLIQKNYVIVPFDSRHLNGCLVRLLKSHGDKMPTRDNLMSDDIMGTLLRQFGDPSLHYSTLVAIAVDWWISILTEREIPNKLLTECMDSVSYALSMHFLGGVIQGTVKEEKEHRLAGIYLRFITRIIDKRDIIPIAWSAIKTVCERLYSKDPEKFTKLIYETIPKMFVKVLEKQTQLTKVQKIELALKFTQYLPASDKDRIESYIRKSRPNFMS